MESKKCKKCNQVKSLTEFSKASTLPDKHMNSCKACNKIYQTAFQKSEHGKELLKNYRQTDKWKKYNREYQREWQQAKRLEEAEIIEKLYQVKLVGF